MGKPFVVALLEARDLPVAERINAEVRFLRELERALGGPNEVAAVYRAWIDASENDATNVDSNTAKQAVRWPKAAEAAHRAGFRDIGDIGEAHFEVRLFRAAAQP